MACTVAPRAIRSLTQRAECSLPVARLDKILRDGGRHRVTERAIIAYAAGLSEVLDALLERVAQTTEHQKITPADVSRVIRRSPELLRATRGLVIVQGARVKTGAFGVDRLHRRRAKRTPAND